MRGEQSPKQKGGGGGGGDGGRGGRGDRGGRRGGGAAYRGAVAADKHLIKAE